MPEIAENIPPWLPPLDPFSGDWATYCERIYATFCNTLLRAKLCFRGHRLSVRKSPMDQDKAATFWHMTSDGRERCAEEDRVPDVRKCERLAWACALIQAADDESKTNVWASSRTKAYGPADRWVISLLDYSYVVIIEERITKADRYMLLITAYPVEYERQRGKLKKEHQAYEASLAQPIGCG